MTGARDEASGSGFRARPEWRGVTALALLVAAGLASAFALGELAVRWVAPQRNYYLPASQIVRDPWRGLMHRASSTPGLHYELVPSSTADVAGTRVVTNRYGMRDDDPLPGDTPGLWRIAVFGDSVSFGYGVAGSETWPSVLERELAASPPESGRRYDVLNFAVSGYSSRDEAAQVEHVVPEWRPRLLIVGYTLNDPETEPFQPLQAYYHETGLWQYSHMLRLLHRAASLQAVRRLGGGDYLRYLHADPEKWGSVVDAFARIARVAGDLGAGRLLVVFPSLPEPGRDWSDYRDADLHQQVARAARAAGFDVLDLLPVLSSTPPDLLRVSRSDGHPNATAHARAARAIADRLRSPGG